MLLVHCMHPLTHLDVYLQDRLLPSFVLPRALPNPAVHQAMPFYIKQLSCDNPGTVMVLETFNWSSHWVFQLLPPDQTADAGKYGEVYKDRYALQLRIVDARGRHCLLFIGAFAGSLHMRGNVENGSAVLDVADVEAGGKKTRRFGSGGSGSGDKEIGIHLTSSGELVFRGLKNVGWKLLGGSEGPEVGVTVPAFSEGRAGPLLPRAPTLPPYSPPEETQ